MCIDGPKHPVVISLLWYRTLTSQNVAVLLDQHLDHHDIGVGRDAYQRPAITEQTHSVKARLLFHHAHYGRRLKGEVPSQPPQCLF